MALASERAMNVKLQTEPEHNQEFAGLPYPLTPPEGSEEVIEEMMAEDATAVLARLLDELNDLIVVWKATVHAERAKLATGQASPEMPMEFRAGLAQGLENAAEDVENVLAKIGR